MSKYLVKLLPVAAALAFSSLSHATTTIDRQTGVLSVVVKYGDLDLATKDGISKLHARLRGAAKQVCSPLDSRVLGLRDQYDACVSDAVKRAVADVGNPNLARFSRYGRHVNEVASS
jgi:UrcA family protein